MSARAALVLAMVATVVAALWFRQTVNSEFAALHRRLDQPTSG